MAKKKSVRKGSMKTLSKVSTATKKKTAVKKDKAKPRSKPVVAKKKAESGSSSKVTVTKMKPKAVAKPTAKKTPAKTAIGKKKVVGNGVVSKKTKTTTKKVGVKAVSQAKKKNSATQKHVTQRKTKSVAPLSSAPKKALAKKATSKKPKATTRKAVVQSVSKQKKPATPKPAVQKKTTSVAKTKAEFGQTRKPSRKTLTSAVSAPQHVSKPKEPLLSSIERYNLGGLFACAIERTLDPDYTRLRAVLRHLGLSSLEKDNLIRLSQGLMIPKLFADSVAEQKVGFLLADLVKFGLAQGNYEKHWCEEIRQVGLWLGVFPAQVQEIEQRVGR